jgi:hypothetical protein
MSMDFIGNWKNGMDMTTFIPATPLDFKLLERYGETKGKRHSYWTHIVE